MLRMLLTAWNLACTRCGGIMGYHRPWCRG
jgi:hypothetical protein